jgi:hypothetical protein
MQTKTQSAVETAVNTGVGFVLSWGLLWLLSLLFGWHNTGGRNTFAVGCFTVLSLARTYFIRRYFNWRLYPARKPESPSENLAEVYEDNFSFRPECNDEAFINETLARTAPSPVPWGEVSVK